MEKSQASQLKNHMDNLSEEDAKAWKSSANTALANPDSNHSDWDHVKAVAKWLGLPVGGAAAGGAFLIYKRVAQAMSAHL